MKQCTQCKKNKTFAEFGRLRSSKDGYRRECRECRKKYYLKPKDHVESWNKKRKERMKIMGLNSRGKYVSEYTRDKMSQSKLKSFKDKNHDYTISAFNRIYSRYLKKGCEINKELFRKLIQSNCEYCGTEPIGISKGTWLEKGKFLYNGLDRVNNDKGYLIDNVVPCCDTCNRAKLAMTIEEFMNWIKRLYKNLTSKKMF